MFEVLYCDELVWEEVEEKIVIKALRKNFENVALVLEDLLNGEVIRTSFASYRYVKEARK